MSDMKTIVVGVDGSPAAQSALEWSAQLVTLAGLELIAARVFELHLGRVPFQLLYDTATTVVVVPSRN
jgi:nucleotide-binding universal stress UspA family protein